MLKVVKQFSKQKQTLELSKKYLSTSKILFNDAKKEDAKENGELDQLKSKLKDLEDKLQEKDAQYKELYQKYLGSMADQENTRRIAKVDVDNAKKYALQGFATSLLEVADNLGLCITTIPKEKQEELKNFIEGIKMTESVLLKVFRNNNIERIQDPTGKEFDPKLHDALMKIPNKEVKSGTVAHMLKTGYTYNERIIRATQVVVVENGDE